MVQMTLELTEDLADRIRPAGDWISTILELSMVGFQSPAAAVAAEVIGFLSKPPTPQQILEFQASERAQFRLNRLLALGDSGLLGEEEKRELDELEHIEHLLVLLKARVAERMRSH